MPTLYRLTAIADHLPDLQLLDLNLISVSPPHTFEDMNTPSDTGFHNVSLSPQEDMNTLFDTSFDNVPQSPQEDVNSVFTSLDIFRDYHADPVVTVRHLLSQLVAGLAPLPPKLETLRLTFYPEYYGCDMQQCIECAEQQETICCLHRRYPSLREVKIHHRHWWREGEHWSCRQENF
ncbi:hypothetical protein M405DRAFT_581298 [Rhizopogon salebrosus TDB-379]|nr:hypothetical protein M405DRAFT_581298 [Rhizopogon salebrosus TDB-379]